MFLASLGVGWVVAGRVLAPIGRITEVARDIQATDLSRRIDLRGPADELRRLADTFDDMLARLDEAFEGQRRFIQEASHELRNPLAVIRTNLDVSLADPDASAEDLRHTESSCNRTAERMSRLVDDLLAYAHRGAPEHDQGPVDIAGVVSEAAAEFAAPAEARGLQMTWAAERGLWVHGDRLALRQALANLLANAVRLAPDRHGDPHRRRLGTATGCGWRSRTRARASPRINATWCSNGSGRATGGSGASTGAAAWAWPSCARSPRTTAARSASCPRPPAVRPSSSGCPPPLRPPSPRR